MTLEEWGRDLAARNAPVLHLRALVFGRVKKFYDGELERSGNCAFPVIELDEGHTFVADRDRFRELSPAEVEICATLAIAVSGILGAAADRAMKANVPPQHFAQIAKCLLNLQAAALEEGSSGGGTF